MLNNNIYTYAKSLKRNWRYLNPFSNKIGYVGWLGHHNLGDEAIYSAFREIFKEFDVLPFKNTIKMEYFEKIRNENIFDAVFLGGGTLIGGEGSLNMIKSAQRKRVPTAIFGTGVRSPVFWGKARTDYDINKAWIECLEIAKYVGVRGPLSQQILCNNGLNCSEIIGDLALFFAKDKIKIKNKNKKLGINIGTSGGNVWGKEDEILVFIVKFAEIMIDRGWDITFLPVWDKDILYIEEAMTRIRKHVTLFSEYNSIGKVIDFLEQCDLFVGEKLHSVVLAMCSYTPSIMLEYRPKCLDFMKSMDLEKFNIRTDALRADTIIDMVDELYDSIDSFQESIYKKANYYKKLQLDRSLQILQMMGA